MYSIIKIAYSFQDHETKMHYNMEIMEQYHMEYNKKKHW